MTGLAGDGWRLHLRIGNILEYDLAARDILQNERLGPLNVRNGVLRGRLNSACFEEEDAFEEVR